MRFRNFSIASRSIVAVHAAVTAGLKVSALSPPVAVCGARGGRIIVPPVNDAVRSHQRAAAKPRVRAGLKNDQFVVIASLQSLWCNQIAAIEDY